jgi:hypothetical protein
VTFYFDKSDHSFDAPAIASGAQHVVSIAAVDTAKVKAGQYTWFARATAAGVSKTVEQGLLDVIADPALSGKADRRSYARRLLEALQATLLGRATDGQLAMSVDGRSISRIPADQLQELIEKYEAKVSTEDAIAAGRSRDLKSRFVSA